MGLKKDDYAERGRADARAESAGEKKPHSMFDRADRCWQARAYWEAFDAEKSERLAAAKKAHMWPSSSDAFDSRVRQVVATSEATMLKPPAGAVPPALLALDTEHWPPGAREHARLLNEDLRRQAGGADSERGKRLRRALVRMAAKHKQPKKDQA